MHLGAIRYEAMGVLPFVCNTAKYSLDKVFSQLQVAVPRCRRSSLAFADGVCGLFLFWEITDS